MKRTTGIVLGLALALGAGGTWAVTSASAEEMAMEQVRTQETIYGSQLMTEQERTEYRQRLTAAKSDEERAQIRAEHHERMMVRAKEKGVTLPEEPGMMGGKGMGMGSGMGAGHPAGR